MTSRFITSPDYYTVEPFSDDPIVTGGLARVKKLDIYYIDINAAYKQNLKGLIIYDEDVVNQQISNILATPLGSDDFEPSYGSNLPYRLYDPITTSTTYLIFQDTIGAVYNWMQKPGRVIVNNATSYARPINDNPDYEGYDIKLDYLIVESQVLATFNAFVLR